jgi:tetratricopeptide (TPR) repeat protein
MSGGRVAVLLLVATAVACTRLADPVGAQESRCAAANALSADERTLDEAAKQYRKALDDPQERDCAVPGLQYVAQAQAENKAAAEKKKKADDRTVDAGEALSTIGDWIRKAWPWVLLFFTVTGLGWAFRLVHPSKRIAIRAAKADETFAGSVVAAASAAGAESSESPTVKVVLGGGAALPQATITDLSKLLALPAGLPLGPLLRFAALPLAPSSLSVGWAAAGGWVVSDLKLKRAWRRRHTARLGLKLGSLEATKQQEAIALVAAAWIVGLLAPRRSLRQWVAAKPKLTTTTKRGDADALLAQAYFRAGANLQMRGNPLTALRCYEAMPAVTAEVAPFAWVGSRLNAMTVLASQGRFDEAIAMAKAVHGQAQAMLDDAGARERYGAEQLRDLRRRTVYLTAILRVDLMAIASTQPRREAAAGAVTLLVKEIQRASASDPPADPALVTAMRMVRLCHAALDPDQSCAPADVDRALGEELDDAANAHPAQPLGAAAYYDAACAYTLIATHNAGPTEDTIKKALATLALAAKATPESSRSRMILSAQTDAMLAALRTSHKAEFDTALGVIPETEPDATLAVTLTETETATAAVS